MELSKSQHSKELAKSSLQLIHGVPVLGTVGRLVEQKGHKILLETISVLKDDGIDVQLILVGEGPLRRKLIAQVDELGLTDRVHFLGNRRDLGDLFRAMDVFVMPSLWEGLSLAMLSAMAAGLPTIATSVGGVGEVFAGKSLGITLPPNDIAALAVNIRYLLDNPAKAKEMGINAKAHVYKNYSVQSFIGRLMNIYELVFKVGGKCVQR
ncbi:MAG: glycosyltransferase [Candidatus Brocadiales bacterium]|nr:glycosyltransferase [Candidatus Brocadiales bacterium]